METVILAKFLGVFFLVFGLGILFNREHAAAVSKDIVAHPASQLLAGVLPLLVGSFVIATHNTWVAGWPLLVTVVGWMMLFAGLFRLWFTSAWIEMIESSQEHLAVIGGLITCVIGALLAYVGFFS